jgi:hypothetical protein
MPVACVSLMRPPAPVSAPGYGATAHGKLCVSAVSRMSQSLASGTSGPGFPGVAGSRGLIRPPRIADELSLKPITEFPGFFFRVSFTSCISVAGAGCPSSTSLAPKNQWRECSLFDCARSNSSTSVGSRLSLFWNRSM